jgi:hypothetical protein
MSDELIQIQEENDERNFPLEDPDVNPDEGSNIHNPYSN